MPVPSVLAREPTTYLAGVQTPREGAAGQEVAREEREERGELAEPAKDARDRAGEVVSITACQIT